MCGRYGPAAHFLKKAEAAEVWPACKSARRDTMRYGGVQLRHRERSRCGTILPQTKTDNNEARRSRASAHNINSDSPRLNICLSNTDR
ncbi:hypothetical protein ACU52_01840 [Xylanibacter rarus]|uniref:Uncharacterized protein n=1 Tax=Xylanibacter rarus TaxID=1676614 RepID=A0A8E1R1A1_9BACT|nr:hypothetical protein ACU52_01840 [Xylanibacter rarus]